MDPQLKQLMMELGDAVNESISQSEGISEVVSRTKQRGYEISMVVEVTISLKKKGELPDEISIVNTIS